MTPSPAAPQPSKSYSLPVVALVLSLLPVCCVVGPILGIVSLVRIGKEPELKGKGLAIASLVVPLVYLPIFVLAAIAIPNFIKFQARSKQSECKLTLRTMATAQRSYQAEKDTFAPTFEECGAVVEPGNRYSYFMGPGQVKPVDTTKYPKVDAEAYQAALAPLGIHPGVKEKSFLIACVGNIDNDSTLDVWTIDESGTPVNVVNDVSE